MNVPMAELSSQVEGVPPEGLGRVPTVAAWVMDRGGLTAWWMAGLVLLTAGLCALAPLGMSLAIVLACAGPHNWFEARYLLTRLPPRAGKLWSFFLASALGVVGLSVGFGMLSFVDWGPTDLQAAVAVWSTAWFLWVALLIDWRSRQNPRFDGGWAWPVAFLGIAGVWIVPWGLSVLLVYLHPLLALWFLDREVGRSRPGWRRALRCSLATVPLALAGLYVACAGSPGLATEDSLTRAIVQQCGAGLFPELSRFLVAAHAFLESLHYLAWIVFIPTVGLKSPPWRLADIPLARRGRSWRMGVGALLMLGLSLVVFLWGAFASDYTTTRSVYFTVAIVHVLAEIPFLLRNA
jgi:hypothetical protein